MGKRRPERTEHAYEKRGGKRSQWGGRGLKTADRRNRPHVLVGFQCRGEQAEQAQPDGGGGSDDRWSGMAQRSCHGVASVTALLKFLAVSGDEQEGVVGARTENQDAEDSC